MKKITQILGIALAVPILTFGSMVPRAYAVRSIEVNIFQPGSAYNIQTLTGLQTNVGVPFTSAKWYMDWSQSFDSSVANRFHNAGYIPEVTWQPQASGSGIPNTQVTSGAYDSYINQTAQSVKSLGYTIRINLAPEMNGDWCTWGVTKNGNTNETHKAFYQYVVQKFRDNGATNVQWIWAPNVHTYGEVYSFAQIFPGDAYVNYVGLDGYNWGTSQSWSTWQTFSQVFDSSYRDLVAISAKPIIITEMASAEVGGNKANWIIQTFSTIRNSYPRIQGFTWFNENKETDWRIESSTASKSAFYTGYYATDTVSPTPTPTATATATAKATSTPKSTASVTATSSSTAAPTSAVNSASSTSSSASETSTPTSDPTLYAEQTSDGNMSAVILPSSTSSDWYYQRRAGALFEDTTSTTSKSRKAWTFGIVSGIVAAQIGGAAYFMALERRKKAALKKAATDGDTNSTDYNATPDDPYSSLYESSDSYETLPEESTVSTENDVR